MYDNFDYIYLSSWSFIILTISDRSSWFPWSKYLHAWLNFQQFSSGFEVCCFYIRPEEGSVSAKACLLFPKPVASEPLVKSHTLSWEPLCRCCAPMALLFKLNKPSYLVNFLPGMHTFYDVDFVLPPSSHQGPYLRNFRFCNLYWITYILIWEKLTLSWR